MIRLLIINKKTTFFIKKLNHTKSQKPRKCHFRLHIFQTRKNFQTKNTLQIYHIWKHDRNTNTQQNNKKTYLFVFRSVQSQNQRCSSPGSGDGDELVGGRWHKNRNTTHTHTNRPRETEQSAAADKNKKR